MVLETRFFCNQTWTDDPQLYKLYNQPAIPAGIWSSTNLWIESFYSWAMGVRVWLGTVGNPYEEELTGGTPTQEIELAKVADCVTKTGVLWGGLYFGVTDHLNCYRQVRVAYYWGVRYDPADPITWHYPHYVEIRTETLLDLLASSWQFYYNYQIYCFDDLGLRYNNLRIIADGATLTSLRTRVTNFNYTPLEVKMRLRKGVGL